ncbi:MAG TPA: response regulator transcription factor [Terracidiphilus sp.]|nr:response regulator transcription factor [Terracidiphilus sp.]
MDEILLIDDDVELCSMLTEYLGKNGFRVKAAHRGDSGLKAAQQRPWSLILLDVMLPGIDGFEVLKRIRSESSVAVLLLTARGEDVDRIVGLEIGADDYLPKPFNPRELLARMRAVLRRNHTASAAQSTVLRVHDLELDSAARRATRAGIRLDLTDVEFALLETLMRSPGKVVNRDQLSQEVLGRPFDPFDRSLDMHVSRLRRKLSQDGSDDDLVKTIRGVGYQLVVDRDFAETGD